MILISFIYENDNYITSLIMFVWIGKGCIDLYFVRSLKFNWTLIVHFMNRQFEGQPFILRLIYSSSHFILYNLYFPPTTTIPRKIKCPILFHFFLPVCQFTIIDINRPISKKSVCLSFSRIIFLLMEFFLNGYLRSAYWY